jgi:hypothetical protein
MGKWINIETHEHDHPTNVNSYVGVGSRWECACGSEFEVTKVALQKGEILRHRGYDLEWKPVANRDRPTEIKDQIAKDERTKL